MKEYPLISEYIEAIESAEDNFEQLKNLRPVLDKDGNPVMSSGNFAVVFKMKDEVTGKLHAVKCFLKEQEGRAEAYRMIAEELEYVNSTFLTPIKYLDKELFVDTKNSNETEFPVLLMDWIEGKTLDKYVLSHKYDAYKLAYLVQNFYKLSKWLFSQSFAHGDLKPDNIIVSEDGHLVLIDYDGMYVPQMFGQVAREQGTPNYRIPNTNKGINVFDKSIDDFAIIHILLSLDVYSLFPHLLNNDNDFALFEYEEFSNISASHIYREILAYSIDKNISTLLVLFQKCIHLGRIDYQDFELLDFTVNENQYENLAEQMCNFGNIFQAMNFAYSSMRYKDPARNEYEVNKYSDIEERIRLATVIHNNLRNHEWPYGFKGIKYSRIKENGNGYRDGVVLGLAEYTLRYLFGLIKYKKIENVLPKYVYSGGKDVFTLNNDEYKYKTQLDEFVKNQELYSTQYKYLYVFDIRNYFKSINLYKLKELYFDNTFANVEWFEQLFTNLIKTECLEGLNPCSEVDFFFANLYLRSLDHALSKFNEIKYLRYCDDLRIFSNNDSLFKFLSNEIQNVLTPLSLTLNSEKCKLIDTAKDKVALATACFVWSDRLYLGIKNPENLLSGKRLKEIIESGLTTTYVFQLLKDIDDKAKRLYWDSTVHLGPLFYILKNVHKNATLYRVVSELIFSIGMNCEQYECEVMGLPPAILKEIIKLLNAENVEPFVKYWVLRTFFCSNKGYYEWYLSKTNGYCNDYLEQIKSIIEIAFRREGSDALLCHLSDYLIEHTIPYDASVSLSPSAYQKKDLINAWTDEHGVMYDSCRKKLLKVIDREYLDDYNIREGTELVCDKAFSECGELTRINIPKSIKRIGVESFYECIGLTNITIPDSVMIIGEKAFMNCVSLNSITIPKRVISIGEEAFSTCCNLSSIFVDSNNVTYDSRQDCNAIIETVSNKLIVGCNNTVIPDTVTYIGNHSFSYREKLTSITIPNSVKSIGNYAFLGCRDLSNIIIPYGLIHIGEGAFKRCRRLSTITIPNSVTTINDDVFEGCTSLNFIYISKGTKAKFEKLLPQNKEKLVEHF